MVLVVLLVGCGSSGSTAKTPSKTPNVVGQPLPSARKALEDLGFKVTASAPDATFGVVDEANWEVKSQRRDGATVTLIVERPGASTTTATPASTSPPATASPGPSVDWLAEVRTELAPYAMPINITAAGLTGGVLEITTDLYGAVEPDAVAVCTNVMGIAQRHPEIDVIQVDASDTRPLAETLKMPNGAGLMCRGESSIRFRDRLNQG
jgi:hypothetical protein